MAELVDAQDLKSCENQPSCRFKSGLRHHLKISLLVFLIGLRRSTQVWLKGPVLKTGRSRKRRRGSNPFFSAIYYIAGWSSLVARWAHNPKVRGSNPLPATNLVPWCSWLTRLPVTQKIAGSSPVGTAIYGFIAQLVEQGTENPCVAGSIPAGATILIIIF